MRSFIQVLAIHLLTTAWASMSLTGPSQIHSEDSTATPIASGDKASFVPQDALAVGTSYPLLQKRVVAGQKSNPSKMVCRGKLQKRGQCLSQLKQNPAQKNQNQGSSKVNSKDHKSKTQSEQQPAQPARPARPARSVVESSLSRISVTSPISRNPHEQDYTEELRNLAATPTPRGSTTQRANSLRSGGKLGKEIDPNLHKVKSAPSLTDMAALQAYLAEKKALSIRKAAVVPGVKARDSMNEAKMPLPPGPIPEEMVVAKIRRHDEANANAHAYARQQKRLSRAYSDAADASREARRPTRASRNKKKQDASRVESEAWRSIAKTSSYWAQFARMKLIDRRVQYRTRMALEHQGAMPFPEARGLLLHQNEQSRRRCEVLGEKWRDTKELAEQQFHELTRLRVEGGYDSEFDEPLMPDAWPRPADRQIVRPYTPSPVSSRGRSEREARFFRMSTDSNTSKYTDAR